VENTNQNPLGKYFRQPKIYIRLPSKGRFYDIGALDTSETGEYPVFAMTAKDELSMKTPDALLNGQATVDVIQSCIPNIRNAWGMPSIDIDAVLTAIRIASYGETMDMTVKLPNTDIETVYTIDLRRVLDTFVDIEYDNIVNVNDMAIHLKPLSYKVFTQNAIKTFEEQRIFSIVNDDSMSDERKIELFSKSFSKLTSLTVSVVAQGIEKIIVENDTVVNPLHIAEFINNADKKFYNAIMDHMEIQKDKFQMQPMKITTTEEQQTAGAPAEVEVPIVLDAANFFA
tara:strand:- start:1116 stop:1970 length:855 start_codon:yes stop_codon:yes gene_type:complete